MTVKLFYILSVVLLFNACKEKKSEDKLYNVRADIRFGNTYYSLLISKAGKGKAIKGLGTYFTQPFKTESSDTSIDFIIDSVDVLYRKLNELRNNPVIESAQPDAARAEIYYDGKKIFDSHNWDGRFWNLFRNFIHRIPRDYNPFRVSDNPFLL